MTLSRWAGRSPSQKGNSPVLALECCTPNMKTTYSFETSKTMQPSTQRYIAMGLNPQHTYHVIYLVNTQRIELKPRDFSSNSPRDGTEVHFC
jgi:hypothetical protein